MLDRFYEKYSNRIIQIIGCWIIFFGLANLFEVQSFGLGFLIPYGYIEISAVFVFLLMVIFGYKLIIKNSKESWVVIIVIFIPLALEDISMVSFCYEKINSEKQGGLFDLINAYSPAFYPRLEMKNALIRIGFMLPILIVLSHRIFLKKFKVNREKFYFSIIFGVSLFVIKNYVLNF